MSNTTFTGGIQSSLSAWADSAGAWNGLLAAYGAMFEAVYGIVADQGSPDVPATYAAGWSTLLDPDVCPTQFLPYLAQFVGVAVPPNTPDAQARALIRAEAGFSRGLPSSIIAAAKTQLSGSQSVQLVERQGVNAPDPYHFLVYVRPEQVISSTALIAAVNSVKPCGLQWNLIQTDGTTWNQETHTWNADTLAWTQKG